MKKLTPSNSRNYSGVKTILLDFDSVICSCESMDLLFEELLRDQKSIVQKTILTQAQEITNLGMSGEIPFSESLNRRLALLPKKPAPLEKVARNISREISASFAESIPSLQKYDLRIVSSGFRQLIEPSLTSLGISPDNIICNSLVLDGAGVIIGVESDNPLSGDNGKVIVVEKLNPAREIIMVGDGYTDFQVAESGAADYFFAYVEHVRRESVVTRADEVIESFHELVSLLQTSQSRMETNS